MLGNDGKILGACSETGRVIPTPYRRAEAGGIYKEDIYQCQPVFSHEVAQNNVAHCGEDRPEASERDSRTCERGSGPWELSRMCLAVEERQAHWGAGTPKGTRRSPVDRTRGGFFGCVQLNVRRWRARQKDR